MEKKEPKKPSSRLLGMKVERLHKNSNLELTMFQFMQRSLEKEVQEQLERERKRVISEAEWVLDTKDIEIQKP